MPAVRLTKTIRRLLLCGGLLTLAAIGGGALAQVGDHQYSATDIQAGFRIYSAQCQLCHGVNGDQIAGVNLSRQRFKRVVSDDDIKAIVTNGAPAAGMPSFRFQPAELGAIAAFIRSGFDQSGTPFKLGNAARGKAVFDGKGACAACHELRGEGRFNAPSLSQVGANRRPVEIQRYLVEPDKALLPINRRATIVTRAGRTFIGRRVNEDTYSVQIRDEGQTLHSIAKADIRSYDLAKTSFMPSYASKLSEVELADLMAYLISLKGN